MQEQDPNAIYRIETHKLFIGNFTLRKAISKKNSQVKKIIKINNEFKIKTSGP